MATKKKTAKKPVAKRTYTRKAPVAKRSYNRKPKAGPVPAVEEACDRAEAVSENLRQAEPSDAKEAQSESNISVLRQIHVIDLRGGTPQNRFAILAMLESEGYITEQLESPVSHDMIREYMFADAVSLNHNNKLISAADWSEASSSYAISRPMVHYSAMIGFSKPEAAYDEKMQVGNATYVRVA